MVVEIDQPGMGKVKLLGNPMKMSETNPAPKGSAHSLGEDTDEVLKELLGVSETELRRIKGEGVL
jgi:CoA:oxalate CoA-transferase